MSKAKYYAGFGEQKSIAEWLRDSRCIVPKATLRNRLKHGMPIERAITEFRWADRHKAHIGKIFNNVLINNVVVRGKNKWGHPIRIAQCTCNRQLEHGICGTSFEALLHDITNGHTKSCGCARVNLTKSNNYNWRGYEDIHGTLFTRIREQARLREIAFNITIEDIWKLFLEQNKRCALTGTELHFQTTNKDTDGTASLDRKDSKLGYVEGNIQWVHKDINKMKNDFSVDTFVAWCKKVADFKKRG